MPLMLLLGSEMLVGGAAALFLMSPSFLQAPHPSTPPFLGVRPPVRVLNVDCNLSLQAPVAFSGVLWGTFSSFSAKQGSTGNISQLSPGERRAGEATALQRPRCLDFPPLRKLDSNKAGSENDVVH